MPLLVGTPARNPKLAKIFATLKSKNGALVKKINWRGLAKKRKILADPDQITTCKNRPPLAQTANYQFHSNSTVLKCSLGTKETRAVYGSNVDRSTQSASCNPWGDRGEDRFLLSTILMLLDALPRHKSHAPENGKATMATKTMLSQGDSPRATVQ